MVRLGLDVASKFLEDPNVKIIYVARDPRGNNTLKSLLLIVYNLVLKIYPPNIYILQIHPFYFWQ